MLITVELVPPVLLSSLTDQLVTKKIHGATVDVDFDIYEGGTRSNGKQYLIVEVNHQVYDRTTASVTSDGKLAITELV